MTDLQDAQDDLKARIKAIFDKPAGGIALSPERRARMTAILTDEQLLDLAKEQLIGLRATQAEIAKRHNARQTPAKAVCGHVARDHSGLCCDDELCPNYVPF